MATESTLRAERRENARRRLEKYNTLLKRVDKRLDLISKTESRILSVTAQYNETCCSGSAKDALADNLAALEEHAEVLRELNRRYGESMDEVSMLVDRVTEANKLAGDVLAARYLVDGRMPDFFEIAEDLGYSEGAVYNAHLLGLDLAAMFIDASATCEDL